MASDLESEAAAAEEEPPRGSAVSELHLALQEVLLEVHKATAQAARHGKRRSAEGDEDPAQALLEAGRRFERLVGVLPQVVRCSAPGQLEEELQELQRQDAEAGEEVERLSARAESLRAAVDASWRQTCEELCGGAVTVSSAKDTWDSEDQQVTASRSPKQSGRPAADHPGHSLRPRLQDLMQDRSRRFIEELEFLQCLANPEYVQWLATHHYFNDPGFVAFLEYLSYWRTPPYVHHVVYPQALRMLEMLQNPAIRCRVHRMDTRALLQGQMMWKWSHVQEAALEPAAPAEPPAAAAAPAPAPSGGHAEGGAGAPRALDVLQDWTSLTGVVADKTWHEKVEGINETFYTVEHDAKAIGLQYMSKSILDRQQLERAVEKFKNYWADERSAGDLGKVLATRHTRALSKNLEIPKEALERLAPSPVLPKGGSMTQAPPRKRGRRS